MLILAGENCDTLLVAQLRDAGHDVAHILEQAPGTPDEAILEAAVAQSRILLTNDLEFGLLAERLGKYPPTIVPSEIGPSAGTAPSRHRQAFFRLRGRRLARQVFRD